MRVEPHTVGSVLHVMQRGTRGLPIVKDDSDRKHFMQSLLYLNDFHQDRNWRLSIKNLAFGERPALWPAPKPLVDVWAWTLMPNHFHLILHERVENGIANFMQRLCGSMSARFNAKYKERGSLFQGSYKGRVVENEHDLRWLASYVMVKNTFELYLGGLERAVEKFDDAWEWSAKHPFSSMPFYAKGPPSPIIETDKNMLLELFENRKKFKQDSRHMLQGYMGKRSDKYLNLVFEK